MPTSLGGMRARVLPISYLHLLSALLCGLALRLFFIRHFSFYAGDTKFYEELARNWLNHGVYGLFVRGQLVPVDLRVPGYPAFLATVYSICGPTRTAVMITQVAIDLVTCVLAALVAAQIAPEDQRSKAAAIALWLAALCPFTASYTAAVLTETLAAFFTTLALLILVWFFSGTGQAGDGSSGALGRKRVLLIAARFLLVGVTAGLGALVRPETPLVLAAAGVLICIQWHRPENRKKLVLAGLSMALGLLAALTPWAARNARTLGRIEFLAPRYAESAGDYIPRGFYGWTRTWMVHYGDAYRVTWVLGKKPIAPDAIPPEAFDSDAERARVDTLLASYNSDLKMTPSLDRKFGELAHEKAAAHPLRTFAFIPVARAFVIWFSPRVDVLRYSGKLWPPGEQRQNNPLEFDVSVVFVLLNIAYVGLALVAAWRYRTNPGCELLALYFLIRTLLLTQLPTVEPRYVVVCFPAVLALGALAFVKPKKNIAPARDSNSATATVVGRR